MPAISDAADLASLTPRLALELVLMALLFASLVSSAMAVRYYNHAGFIDGMPVDSDARQRRAGAGSLYVHPPATRRGQRPAVSCRYTSPETRASTAGSASAEIA